MAIFWLIMAALQFFFAGAQAVLATVWWIESEKRRALSNAVAAGLCVLCGVAFLAFATGAA